MEKHETVAEEQRACPLQEFIQWQRLVEWPVTCEENTESCSHLYDSSGEIYEDLKARVPFPSNITESLRENLEKLWIKVKLQHSVFLQESGGQVECDGGRCQ